MIVLPLLFEEKLKRSPELESFVKQTFFAFEPWLRDSGMPFFPGFTDHSPVHIEEVLNTAASLVADDAHNLISAADVAVLCMAILLHDCGMHLTPDVFRKMVSSDDDVLIDGFDDQPWKTLWTDFLSEAGRFSQEKNHAIFGDNNTVNIADFDVENLSERDMLLVGEFVRRHHTRIAHEIGIFGVGIGEEEKIKLHGFDLEMRDMAGLIARSHGMYIRETFPYIEKKFGLVLSFRDVKVPFLMALLRIADYIQVQSERAIKTLLSVKELKSPISRQEWMAHFAVRDVSNNHDDPEALYVHAMPKDVKGFLKLSNLFKDIQRELDVTWSTLGEVYGRHKDYKKLGLSLRRIRSNLDNVDNFSKNVSYIPVRARFDASGPDLLRLLVGPLYDYDFSIGVRELVQNAVDACRESLDIYQSSGLADEIICPSVRVAIEENVDGGGTISITDTGVGMTLKTVTNYFLIAGASFRNSDIWKQQHLDDAGSSKVTRGGRFGVGALAAFLLGDELKVKTRHITSSEADGIEFTARIDDSTVELRRCNAPVGTTIVVRIENVDVINSLRPFLAESLLEKIIETQAIESWSEIDWFAQREPLVEYNWNGFDSDFTGEKEPVERRRISAKYLRQEKNFIPARNEDLSSNLRWRPLLESLQYKAIFWEKPKNINPDVGSDYWVDRGAVYVNGLFVEKVDYKHQTLKFPDNRIALRAGYKIARPSLSIVDANAICPINLQRSAVAFDRMGIDELLAAAILSDHFSEWDESFKKVVTAGDFLKACKNIDSSGLVRYIGQLYPLAVSKRGIFLAQPEFFIDQNVSVIYFFDESVDESEQIIEEILEDSEVFMIRRKSSRSGIQKQLEWFRGIMEVGRAYPQSYSAGAGLPQLARKFTCDYISIKDWDVANEKTRVRRELLNSIDVENVDTEKLCISLGSLADGERIKRRVAVLSTSLGRGGRVSAMVIDENIETLPNAKLINDIWISKFGK